MRAGRLSVGAAAAAALIGLSATVAPPSQAQDLIHDGDRLRLVVVANGGNQAGQLAETLADLAPQGLAVVEPEPSGRSLTVEVPAGSAAQLAAEVKDLDDVAEVLPETTYSLFDVPDDPQWSRQSASLEAVKLTQAWAVTHGSADVIVGVVDSGVTVGHPDLDGKIVGTHDAARGGTSVVDEIGHGTMVASIAAAETDNGRGVAGSGWNASILAVKVADSRRVITNAALADGIDWAVDHGADVINLSLGSSTNDPAVAAAVARAVAADVVVVAAAGNSAASTKFYPAALPGVLAVGATTVAGGARASFSQYGSWVDVGAPGVAIMGANAAWETDTDYEAGDGTSFASPLVAGIAALLRASRPELNEAGIRSAITSTTTPKDFGFAAGLVDAVAALEHALVLEGPEILSPSAGATVTGTISVRVRRPSGVVADHVQAHLLGGGPSVKAEIDVGTGVATLELPTFGSSGAEILRIVLCRQTLCSSTGTDRDLVVQNGHPTLTTPAEATRVTAAFDLMADASGPAVRFLADGTTVLGTDVSAPFGMTIPIGRLAPGPHTLTALVCDATGLTCADDDPSAAVVITVARLSPEINSLSPRTFSPDGDGRRDATTLTYTLDVASDVTITILRSNGTRFVGRHLGSRSAGSHTWTWGGRNGEGATASSGTFTLELDTVATVSSEVLRGQVTRTVVIDKANPSLARPSSTYPTVYPVKDGFRDSTSLSVTVSEPTRSLTAMVYDASGRLVWTATRSGAAEGRASWAFQGRSTSGAPLPAGTYRYAFKAADHASNVTRSARSSIRVSAKRLSAARTASRTLTAEKSFDVWGNDDNCSGLYLSGWAPGALRWDSCPGGSVVSWHHLTIPRKAAYGTVRVSTYARGGSGSSAYCAYVDDDDTYHSETRFDDDTETHWAARVPLTVYLLKGRMLRWAMFVEDGDTYAAQTFTVTWTYYDLV